MLGVDVDTAVALGPEVSADAKFVTSAESPVAQQRKLLEPSAKKVAKATKKAPASNGDSAKKKTTSSKRSDAKKSTKSKGGWKKARVSWYGPGFYGKGMAGGGKLKRNSMVCAHRSLPFGTKIQFSYKGRKVTAVVKDRGPFIAGRVFDLGPGPAKALKFSGVGTVKYRIIK
jgi:rare lipoprotein A (peptidoglycan hydrolase)